MNLLFYCDNDTKKTDCLGIGKNQAIFMVGFTRLITKAAFN